MTKLRRKEGNIVIKAKDEMKEANHVDHNKITMVSVCGRYLLPRRV